MKLSGIIKFSADGIMRKFFKSLAISVLFAFSFILIAMCMIPNLLAGYNCRAVDRTLSGGVKRTGVIDIKEYKDGCREFINDLSNIEGIEASGAIFNYSTTADEYRELRKIQNGHIPEELIYDDSAFYNRKEFYIIDFKGDAWEIHNLKLAKGSYKPNTSAEDVNTSFLYLGSAFSDIPVGTEYNFEGPNDYKHKIIVKGILEKGSACTTSNLDDKWMDNPKTINLDYMGVMVHNSYSGDEGLQSKNLFKITEQADMQTVINDIYVLAGKYELGVTVGAVEGFFEEEKRTYAQISNILLELLIIVIIVSAIMQACVQITDIIGHFHMYGVLYAGGAAQKDICLFVIIENAVRYIAACLISYGIIRILIRFLFSNVKTYNVVMEIFHRDVLAWVYIIGLAVCFVSIIVPLLMIWKKAPVELVNNNIC